MFMRFDRKKFYALFRPWFKKTHGTSLSADTVAGLNFILDCIENDPEWTNLNQVANFLAQTGHESMWLWKPVKEKRGRSGTRIRAIQDKYWGTGYFGRGIVQLTHLRNYQIFGKLLKIALVANPDLALDPRVSYLVAAIGMRKGLFTGKKLGDFIKPGKTPDYKGARKVVNGTDRDDDIARYSIGLENVLEGSIDDSAVSPIPSLINRTGSSNPVIQPLVEEPKSVEEPVEESPNEVTNGGDSEPVETLPTTEGGDEYPNEPKPGEAVPDEPAKPGEPVAGGRTTDETVSIAPAEAEKPKGWQLWKTTIAGWITTAGISIGSIGSYLSGAVKDPTAGKILLILGGLSLIAAILVGITYLIIRAVLLVKREKQAHELTMKQLEIRANPALYNVKVDVPKMEQEPIVSFK